MDTLVLMSQDHRGELVKDADGDLVYTFAVAHFLKEALEHGKTLAEVIAEFDKQTNV